MTELKNHKDSYTLKGECMKEVKITRTFLNEGETILERLVKAVLEMIEEDEQEKSGA